MKPVTWNAYGPHGLLRSFNAWDLAICYQAAMTWMGTPVTIRRAILTERAA